jgi:hypothetical protein
MGGNGDGGTARRGLVGHPILFLSREKVRKRGKALGSGLQGKGFGVRLAMLQSKEEKHRCQVYTLSTRHLKVW